MITVRKPDRNVCVSSPMITATAPMTALSPSTLSAARWTSWFVAPGPRFCNVWTSGRKYRVASISSTAPITATTAEDPNTSAG